MSTHNTPADTEKALTLKQQQAVLLLAQGSTIDATSKAVGVNEKTVDLWKRQPEFKKALREAEDAIYSDSLKLLKRVARAAIMTLVACMDSKISPYVRVAAASKLLEQGIETHKIADLEREIQELKMVLHGQLWPDQ